MKKKIAARIHRPLITVVTITYNAEKTVVPTMKSIAEQNFDDFEHLVVDGASTDGTLSLVRLHKSKNLRTICQPDEGLYDAMNKGLEGAHGKYVLFLNAGDSFHSPDTLGLYAKAAQMHEADIIYGDTVIVDSDRRVLRPRHLQAPRRLTARSFLRGMLICHQAFMVRREIAPLYNLGYRFSADYDWCLNCIHASHPDKRIALGTVTADYLDDGMTEHNKMKSLWERFKIMCRHFGAVRAIVAHLMFIPRALRRHLYF